MNELKRKFISKTVIKLIIFAFLMTIILFIAQSVSPILSNHIALGQMQNSDEAFIFMNTYNKFGPIFRASMIGICILYVVSLAKDTYKFVNNIKNIKKEN